MLRLLEAAKSGFKRWLSMEMVTTFTPLMWKE